MSELNRTVVLALGAFVAAALSASAQEKPKMVSVPPIPREATNLCTVRDGDLAVPTDLLDQGPTLHAKPRMNAIVTGLLPLGADGIVQGRCKTRLHNQWCDVTWGCLSGYVRMVHVTTEQPASIPRSGKVTGLPVDGALTLYAAPNGHAEKVTAISPTAKVTVYECTTGGAGGEWCAIAAGSKTGWASKQYLQF